MRNALGIDEELVTQHVYKLSVVHLRHHHRIEARQQIAEVLRKGMDVAEMKVRYADTVLDAASDRLVDRPEGGPPADDGKVDFVKHVVPIFQNKCIKCHGTKKKPKGKFNMVDKDAFFKGGTTTDDEGWAIVTPGSRELDDFSGYVHSIIERDGQ